MVHSIKETWPKMLMAIGITAILAIAAVNMLRVDERTQVYAMNLKPQAYEVDGTTYLALTWIGVGPGDQVSIPTSHEFSTLVGYWASEGSESTIEFYIVEGGQAHDVALGRNGVDVYHREEVTWNWYPTSDGFVRPPPPEGRVPQEMVGFGCCYTPAGSYPYDYAAENYADPLGLDLVWVLRSGQADGGRYDSESQDLQDMSRRFTSDLMTTPPLVLDGEELQFQERLVWVGYATAFVTLGVLVWWGSERFRPSTHDEPGPLSAMTRLAQRADAYLRSLRMAVASVGIAVGACCFLMLAYAYAYVLLVTGDDGPWFPISSLVAIATAIGLGFLAVQWMWLLRSSRALQRLMRQGNLLE